MIKTQEVSAPCDARGTEAKEHEAKEHAMVPQQEDKAKMAESYSKKKDLASKRKRADAKGDAKEKGSSSEDVSFLCFCASRLPRIDMFIGGAAKPL